LTSSKVAREVSVRYGKVREAELERNVWTFATRRTTLRAIDANTMLLAPALWVDDHLFRRLHRHRPGIGNLWISKARQQPRQRAAAPRHGSRISGR
jgi:hypothetical protein